MDICLIEDCTDIGYCFGGLCKQHYEYRIQDDPSFDPGSEPKEVKKAREAIWFAYCRAEAAHKTRRTVEALSLALIHEAPLLGRAIWHSRRLDNRYTDERRPLYRTLLQLTHTLGHQIYSLQEPRAPGIELMRPLHGISTAHLVSFQRITSIIGWRRGFAGVPVAACKLIQKVANHLRSVHAFPRTSLLAIGRTAYQLATVTRAFERLSNEIGMRAVHAILFRQTAASVLPSAALQAFGSDHQNVHTPIAVGPTEQALAVIMSWPSVPNTSLYFPLSTITTLLGTPSTSMLGSTVWAEMVYDMSHCISFCQSYGDVLNRVVTKIHAFPMETQPELFQRLTEEVAEGSGLCVQGKMTRLANVLRGFEPTIDACVSRVPSREEFQNRFVYITKSMLPISMQKELAVQLLEECLIPEEERGGWLSALEE